jgi:hypothetical protein
VTATHPPANLPPAPLGLSAPAAFLLGWVANVKILLTFEKLFILFVLSSILFVSYLFPSHEIFIPEKKIKHSPDLELNQLTSAALLSFN